VDQQILSGQNLQVFEMNHRVDLRWELFISSHPKASIYHHSGWLSALECEYSSKCVALACADEMGQVNAILPLLRTEGLPVTVGSIESGRRLSSLPRTPVAGPLSRNEQATKAIINYAVELARSEPAIHLEIKTDQPNLDESVECLSCSSWRPTYVEELPSFLEGKARTEFWERLRSPRPCVVCEGCRHLRFGNAKRQHRVKWAVDKARKLGLEVRDAVKEGDLSAWYQLYLLTMRHNAVPPRPFRFFQSLWSSLHSTGNLRLILAERTVTGETTLVAGSILLHYGQTAFHAFTGCDPKDFHLHPHDILQIEAIRGACRGGYRWYDFGEVAEEHESLSQFKTKFGGRPKPLYRYYFPARPEQGQARTQRLASVVRRVWRRLPIKATAVLGDLIYRRM
jgi:Acetyltransferase (GNAT) domain